MKNALVAAKNFVQANPFTTAVLVASIATTIYLDKVTKDNAEYDDPSVTISI